MEISLRIVLMFLIGVLAVVVLAGIINTHVSGLENFVADAV